jgi:5-methylcytosine-specific restriction enzyme A
VSPIRLCSKPGCPNTATVRGRCVDHASQARKQNRSVNDAFYSSKAWKMSRRAQLFCFPLCQYQFEDGTECGEVADSVHHVLPIEEGGARRDPRNLMSTCRSCHAVIHAQRNRGRAAR